MTATKPTPYQVGSHVQAALEVALGPGGSLHANLSDLLSRASGVAMDAAGVPKIDDRGLLWPWPVEALSDRIRWEIAEEFFRVAKHNAEDVR